MKEASVNEIRRKHIAAADTVIIKVGTRLLIDRAAIARLVAELAKVHRSGKKVLLVSSGAVGMGMEALGIETRPRDLATIQALAAVGQGRLMSLYNQEAAKYDFQVAQLLLTAADLNHRERSLNVFNSINALWEHHVLPIVNENDSVSVDELKFGDNDTLAALLSALTGAQLTILLTNVAGLRRKEANGELGEVVPVVPKVNAEVRSWAGGTDDGKFSVGGMSSKLKAAEIAGAGGSAMIIADGREAGIISEIMEGREIGTLFLPQRRLPGRLRWLGYLAKPSGTLVVDAGAEKALAKQGKSLLPGGLKDVNGSFKRGAVVEISSVKGYVFAKGRVNFSSEDCLKIAGHNTDELHKILGVHADDEVIHRNNMLLI